MYTEVDGAVTAIIKFGEREQAYLGRCPVHVYTVFLTATNFIACAPCSPTKNC